LRSIELFFIKAAPQLSGYFQDPFWKFVLQVSFDEVSIRHALIAISAVYEEECMVWEPSSRTAALKKLSLDYYNRAIRSMVKKMQEKDSIIVPVIGCLLFVCLEFLRRDIWAAIKHIDGGIKMIEQARAKTKNPAKMDAALPSFETELVERVISPLVSSLNITASVFGRPGMYFFSRHGEPESSVLFINPMRTMEEAVTSLLDLTNTTTRFLHSIGKKKYTTGMLEMSDYVKQKDLLKMFAGWKSRFDSLEDEQGELWVSNIVRGKSMLRAVHLTISLWLDTSCTTYESAWDAHKEKFEELMGLVEGVMKDDVRFAETNGKAFSFELGIIPALELIARKCRYPKIRRRALLFLRKSPKRECLFDSFYSAVLDERVMELEEQAFKLPPGQIPDENQLPPEHARIHLIFFAYEEIPGLRGWPVSFLSKPRGPNEDWFIRKELLDAEGSFMKWKPAASPFNKFSTAITPPRSSHPYDSDKPLSPAPSEKPPQSIAVI
jgi:transcription factor-like protein